METKYCYRCKKHKEKVEFHRDKSRGDGLKCICKSCSAIVTQIYNESHIEERIVAGKKYREENVKKEKERHRKYREDNLEKVKANSKKYYEKNKKKIRKKHKEYYQTHKKEIREWSNNWRKEHIDEHREYMNLYTKERKRNNPQFKLSCNMANHIGYSLKSKNGSKGGRHWEKLVDFTVAELKKHLEGKFTKGMTWNNYGKWHVDHIIPISKFNFSLPEHLDFKRCWSLENLQPMWAEDNRRKSDKLEESFQPNLAL